MSAPAFTRVIEAFLAPSFASKILSLLVIITTPAALAVAGPAGPISIASPGLASTKSRALGASSRSIERALRSGGSADADADARGAVPEGALGAGFGDWSQASASSAKASEHSQRNIGNPL